MIVVKPNLGLANRMRVLNSCLALSIFSGAKIQVIWKKDKTLNCGFEDIFKPIDNIEIVAESKIFSFYSAQRPVMQRFHKRYYRKLLNQYYALNNKFFNEQSVVSKRFDDDYWKKLKGNIIIDTCHDFFSQTAEYNYYHEFIPVPEIQSKIDQLTKYFDQTIIGIHIRRSDNIQARSISKQEFFFAKVHDMIEKNAEAKFYLSTDDLQTEILFKDAFKNNIIIHENKKLDRNSKEGIQDAAVDMFALSKTSAIMGSWWSSYSIIAACIGKIKVEIIRS